MKNIIIFGLLIVSLFAVSVSAQCYSGVNNLPANCSSTITQDTKLGCRTITCGSSSGNIKVLACDKPDSGAKYFFEMYRQGFSGLVPRLCIGNMCIQNEGFLRSQEYQKCTNTTSTTTTNTTNTTTRCIATTETCDGKDNDCDGQVDEGCSTNSTNCKPNMVGIEPKYNLPFICQNATKTSDVVGPNCRTIVCKSGENTITAKACEKGVIGSEYVIELYRQSYTGIPPKACFDKACVQNNGFARAGYSTCS